VVAGVAVTHVRPHRTALIYCAVIAMLVAVAAGSLIVSGRFAVPVIDPGGTARDKSISEATTGEVHRRPAAR
jgi:hypothetical protein